MEHASGTQVYDTICSQLHHPILKEQSAITVQTALHAKNSRTRVQELASQDGPWPMIVKNVEVEFQALTCIKAVINVVELVKRQKQSSKSCWDKVRKFLAELLSIANGLCTQ